jgi:DNA mismatch repair protein MutL
MIIDQKRAHERILFEKFLTSALNHRLALPSSSYTRFTLNSTPADYNFIKEIMDDLSGLGFDIRDFGK